MALHLRNAIEMDRHAVGVKLIKTKEEFDLAEAQPLTGKLPYCVMIRAAASGHGIKAAKEHFGCCGGSVALGIVNPDTELYPDKEPGYYQSGHPGFDDMKIYCNLEVARQAGLSVVLLQDSSYGVMVKPLEQFTEDPDVVIMITRPFGAMRIIQGYSYMFGTYSAFRLAGNQAMCSELTTYPLTSGEINISMMCSGARMNAGWKKEELGIGIPFSKMDDLLNGIYQTVNQLERDPEKHWIEDNMNQSGENLIDIVYGHNYDTGEYEFGKGVRR